MTVNQIYFCNNLNFGTPPNNKKVPTTSLSQLAINKFVQTYQFEIISIGHSSIHNRKWILLYKRDQEWEKTCYLKLVRMKNGFQRFYQVSHFIERGGQGIVLEMTPESGGKPKIIKLDFADFLKQDLAIMHKIYENGPVQNIILPPKAFFISKSKSFFKNMMVMSRYEGDIVLWSKRSTTTMNDLLIMSKELVVAIIDLKKRELYHGDIKYNNILWRQKKDQNRFDIADWTNSLSLAQCDKQKFIKFIKFGVAGSTLEDIEKLKSVPEDEAQNFAKDLLYKFDATSMGLVFLNCLEVSKRNERSKAPQLFEELFKISQELADYGDISKALAELGKL